MEVIKEIIEEVKMYLELRKITPRDCRKELLKELISSPQDLRDRYRREMKFRDDMGSRWQR
jgi:hypothetical protein